MITAGANSESRLELQVLLQRQSTELIGYVLWRWWRGKFPFLTLSPVSVSEEADSDCKKREEKEATYLEGSAALASTISIQGSNFPRQENALFLPSCG